jgi:hypothetical protein
MLKSVGYEIRKIENEEITHRKIYGKYCDAEYPYRERKEYGASNLFTKLENTKNGEPFEYPDIVNLNNAVVLLLEDDKKIAEIGSGTGKFANKASDDVSRRVVASEYDQLTYEWCLENIPIKKNLQFINGPIPTEICPFDVSVSIEVVEHVNDYVEFLRNMKYIAPRSLITTPNRKRSSDTYHSGPPPYFKHVREWTAGEFYWILRCFWDDVRLYALTSQTEPKFVKVDIDTELSPLIADCRSSIQES